MPALRCWHSEHLGEACAALLGEHGNDITDEQVRQAWEVADRWFWDDYHRPENDTWGDDAKIDAAWRQYHSLMLGELGVDDPGHRLIEAILSAQYAPESWELYPDVLPAIRELRKLGSVGIASDWGSNLLPYRRPGPGDAARLHPCIGRGRPVQTRPGLLPPRRHARRRASSEELWSVTISGGHRGSGIAGWMGSSSAGRSGGSDASGSSRGPGDASLAELPEIVRTS